MGAITGNQNPIVGETNSYGINLFGALPFISSNASYEWYLFKKQKSGGWMDITKNGVPKKGMKVDYKFFEPVAGELFEIRVFEVVQGLLPSVEPSKKLFGKLEVTPAASRNAQIDKVVLFNRGKKDINRANYTDTLVAQAFCTGLFGKEIEFQLWEDDAAGKGHDAAVNKNNKIPHTFKATVNERGIAEAKILLSADEKIMRQVANKFLMKGDSDEGANHEYYVTATYLGKGEKASQINVLVANPDYQPKPKTDSPKFPATSTGKTPKQPDAKGKILDAYFADAGGGKLTKVQVGKKVQVKIKTSGMVGKHVQYKIWEYDLGSNDLVYESGKIKVVNDLILTGGFTISQGTFGKGIDFGSMDSDSGKQNYFLEVIPIDVSAESQKFGVNSDGLMEVEKVRSPTTVNPTPEKDDKKSDKKADCCIIDEEYFLKNYELEFPKKSKQGKLIPLSNSVKNSLRRMFRSISEYYSNEKRCCNKYHIAYLLATAKLETGHTFDPVEEANWLSANVRKKYFQEMYDPVLGKSDKRKKMAKDNENTKEGDGEKYYGRGYVQLTWKKNYRKMQEKFGVNLVDNRENALNHELAVKIMIYGSEKGVFTGRKLSDYITNNSKDYYNARRVINGVDQAAKIQGYAEKIEKCLKIKECNCKESSSKSKPQTKEKYNIEAAVNYINKNALAKSEGACAKYVRKAINAGGIANIFGHATEYYDTDKLVKYGFTKVGTDINSITLKKGDIAAFGSVKGHPYGHVAMWNGTQWVSDFKQKSFWVANQYSTDKKYAIYRWNN
ncbi:hypothetical protein [Chryseobacterium gregarium]|uniref:hypothetical protein n=1 Tax=Chryseobacterium gregarium TaxID=456299 RepID=UPI0004009F6A|nr:hypothetical protein [Chryseobacterium gregarium]